MASSQNRAMWSGTISFGLVNIPIKLMPAVREKNIHFHLLHDQDHARLQRRMVCSADGKEVHPEHMVRGYEIAPDQYVVVQDRELEALAPKASRTIEIQDFVDVAEIDPLYFDRPYYLEPDENAAKSYALLVSAMEKSKRIAIATFVMRGKEYLAALRPVNGVICLSTLHYSDEVLPTRDVASVRDVKLDDRQVKVAQQLIDQLTTDFKPSKYHDDYQDRVRDMIEKKARGEKIVSQPAIAQKPHRVANLMDALERSVNEARRTRTRAKVHGSSTGHNGHSRGHDTRRRKSA